MPIWGLLLNTKIAGCVIAKSEIPRLSLRGWQYQPWQSQDRLKTGPAIYLINNELGNSPL